MKKLLFILTLMFLSPFSAGAESMWSDLLIVKNERNTSVTLDQAVQNFKKKDGVRILSAKQVMEDGVTYFLIKIISKGRVRVYKIDPATGWPIR